MSLTIDDSIKRTYLVALDQAVTKKRSDKKIVVVSFVAMPCNKEKELIEILTRNRYPVFLVGASKFLSRNISKLINYSKGLNMGNIDPIAKMNRARKCIEQLITEIHNNNWLFFHSFYTILPENGKEEIADIFLIRENLYKLLTYLATEDNFDQIVFLVDFLHYEIAALYNAIIDFLHNKSLLHQFQVFIKIVQRKAEVIFPQSMLADIIATYTRALIEQVERRSNISNDIIRSKTRFINYNIYENELQNFISRTLALKNNISGSCRSTAIKLTNLHYKWLKEKIPSLHPFTPSVQHDNIRGAECWEITEVNGRVVTYIEYWKRIVKSRLNAWSRYSLHMQGLSENDRRQIYSEIRRYLKQWEWL